ncbi:MAG: molybdopterin-dependent oxidoreductase, partial [Planctomycetes bacterium]|nr:molybdopterin-dependent oxidoreductase [Planctomycetota bacterium]
MADDADRPPLDGVNRRTFLTVLGGAGAGAAVASCTVPPETIIPYVIPPEETIPGVATFYATVCRECPAGCGMLVRTREGRAVKVEGNPAHPINRGGLCVRGQASLQGLYNPDRIDGPRQRTRRPGSADRGVLERTSWDEAQKALTDKIRNLRNTGRADHIAVITPLVTGSLDTLVDAWTRAIGAGRRLRYEPFAYEAIRAANRLTFGQDAIPTYDFARARVLVSLGADFLETWLSNVGYARDFAETRTLHGDRKGLFVHVEPRLSMTAANADEWLALEPGTEMFLVLGMIHVILGEKLAMALPPAEAEGLSRLVKDYSPEQMAGRSGVAADKIRDLARTFCNPQAGPGAS